MPIKLKGFISHEVLPHIHQDHSCEVLLSFSFQEIGDKKKELKICRKIITVSNAADNIKGQQKRA